ncbi:uncharacterized protein LOC141685855 [Apium graveolens]|uniref:uncharacterized protein LOC141685855 n=1 Tax=Apium graveolens TaxID=4045 RepID=UPI003D7B5DB4
MFKITSQLKLCGENITEKDMLEKTNSTFHANNMIPQQQYCEREFQKYSELISFLLLAEQNNELLIKNYQARPTGSTLFLEVNVVISNDLRPSKQFGRGRGRGRGFGRARGYARGCGFLHDRGHNNEKSLNFKKNSHHQKWMKNDKKPKVNMMDKRVESTCHHYRMKGHWSRTCCTSKHLVDLYNASLKNIETNFIQEVGPLGISHLKAHLGGGGQVDPSNLIHMEASDFFDDGDAEMAKFGGGNN